ncbi:cation-binding protein [Porphyromonadaceae bacterium COT-184 OH4590]|nr:cation-binding protein [Porphyromonadaceae bacterium COT-184 OH4590]MDO4726467.1 hemerythrin domain-containing protein [Porphyromonadaceae bacterium]
MYKPSDKMSDLITSNYKMLFAMTRIGIPLGFGDKTIDEVCRENNIDVTTFLVIVAFLLDDVNYKTIDYKILSLKEILNYLKNSHDYFLNFRLPNIREKLYNVVNQYKNEISNELSKAIIFYFDEYVAEVRKHMEYEDKMVFPYINSLIKNAKKLDYNIDIFIRQHNHVEERMTEFKNIIIKYYPAKSTNEINSVLFDIFACEEDLFSHIDIEDKLLVPVVQTLEKKLKSK